MSDRERARELVGIVCRAVGAELADGPTKEGVISDVEYWLRDNPTDEDGDYW